MNTFKCKVYVSVCVADDQNGFGSSHSDSAVSAAAPQVSIRGAAGKEKTEGATTDKMEESLTCIVCQDLLHDCVRLVHCAEINTYTQMDMSVRINPLQLFS